MAQALYNHGDPIMRDYTPGSDVTAGDVIVTNGIPEVAHVDIAADKIGSLAARNGVYICTADGAMSANAVVYWDDSANKVTLTSTGNARFGHLTDDTTAAADGDLVHVLHDPLSGASLPSGTIGASTAAAGSTNADAGALPAGTAEIYPTTGADDTKGVILSTSDKVTGRKIFIGNGVSNKILKVYPPSGGTINGASADAAFSSASGKGVTIVCLSSGSNTWLAS
jgi:predicted RecA/RadA family phage recombinase